MSDLDYSRSRLKPFRHQVEDTQSLLDNPFFFITSEMRTGKTKIVIDAAQFLYERNIIDRVLVLAPAPVRDVWFDPDMGEIQKHTWVKFPVWVKEFHSVSREWKKDVDPKAPRHPLRWVVTNFEFIRSAARLRQLATYTNRRTLLVVDESSFVKTYDAAQTKATLQLRNLCGRVVLLNGTPISHSPLDLFSQGNILHPSILNCKYITHFRARYALMGGFEVRGHPTQITGWINLDDLQRRFAPYVVRRLQKDCLDLPPKLDAVTLTATLTAETWRQYKQMRDDCVLMFGSSNASIAAQAITKTIRLAQITSGFVGGIQSVLPDDIEDGERPNFIEHNPLATKEKVPEVVEVGREKLDVILWFLKQRLEEIPDLHIIIWCRFRVELFRMLNEVKKRYPQFEMGAIHGGQKKQERLATMQLLHPSSAPKGPVFVGGTYGTGSFGLNFTAANHSINCSYDYSLAKFLQAGDRVYGPGQTTPIAYFDVVATGPQGQKTIDHHIVKARRNREDVANWTAAAWIKALKEE